MHKKNKYNLGKMYGRIEYAFFFLLLVVTLFSFANIKLNIGRAEVATFHPSTCLGGWENAALAQGEPDVPIDHAEEMFNKDNSATVTNSNAKIFCGVFTGDIPAKTKPKSMQVSLSWLIKDEKAQEIIPTENNQINFL